MSRKTAEMQHFQSVSDEFKLPWAGITPGLTELALGYNWDSA